MKQQLQTTRLSTFLFSFLFSLFSIFLQAQDYQYQWAKSGGGGLSASGAGFDEWRDETIRDVVVDADNNYYFLISLQGGTRTFEEITLGSYGAITGVDILIVALDCEGSFLWNHIIGGRLDDQAYKLGLDSTNGLYISVDVHNAAYIDNVGNEINFPPVHFSEDDVMPLVPAGIGIAHEGYKTGFLLKFDKDTGDLLWRKDLQGLVTQSKRAMSVGRIFIDSNDVIHQIVGLQEGTHLDGLVTVEEEDIKYFLVKYDTNGSILGTPQELPMTGNGFAPQFSLFVYDEPLNRYYIAGKVTSFTYEENSFNGEGFYILSFDGTTFDELWRKEVTRDGAWYSEHLKQIAIDENSNIYLVGGYSYTDNDNALIPHFGDFTFPFVGNNTEFGRPPFTLKLNSSGDVQWIRVPDGYTTPMGWGIITSMNYGVALNGNEVAVLANGANHIWGDFSVNRTDGHSPDPVLLRLDKETGEVLGLHDVLGKFGDDNHFTAIATDNDGNYIVGGRFSGYQGLFTDSPNGVGPLSAMGKTDFFMAKLSAYACGSGGPGNPCEEIELPIGNTSQEVQAGMTLADLQVAGENLQWYADAELTEPLSETHIIENNTTYYVTQTLGGCTSAALAVTVSTLGVSDFHMAQIKLYPNPTDSKVYVDATHDIQSYEVYNLIGQRLLSGSFTGSIDMKDISKGTYIIKLTIPNGAVFTEKVIKE